MTMKFKMDAFDPGVARMMEEDKDWRVVTDERNADVFVFTGGDDVNPALYGEAEHRTTMWSRDRHERCLDLYEYAENSGKPKIGVCRGAQFLCVMSGNRLWQDVTRHAIYGTHEAVDLETRRKFQVTSTHHQMMRLNGSQRTVTESEVLAVAYLGSIRETMADSTWDEQEAEIEAMWHPQVNALSYQPHPEYRDSNHDCRVMFWHYVNKYLGL